MTLHADALAVLRAWDPPDPGQTALRDRYVAHLADHPDGLARGCYPDHLTASTVVLSADGTRVLLTLHAKAQRWFQFGGHCEPGDHTLAGAAEREAVEESGIAGLRVGSTRSSSASTRCRSATRAAACTTSTSVSSRSPTTATSTP